MLSFSRQLLLRTPALARPRFAHRGPRHLQCSAFAMMMSPPELAAQRAGLTMEEAFAMDQPDAQGRNMYQRLGEEPFRKLAHEFYDRVYADDLQWFKDVFANSPKPVAIRNNWEFMVQRAGGPALYSQRKGHPALPRRHAPHECTVATAERYMMHMDAALAVVPELSDEDRRKLHNYFLHTCHFLAVAQELRQGMAAQAAAEQQGQPPHASS